jgi:excisionase family DNA binding protein
MEHSDRLTLTVKEAGKKLGLSRGLMYEAIRRGQIPSIRIGRRILIPRLALERLLQDHSPNGVKDTGQRGRV